MQYAVPSARAQIIEARTYLRPTNAEGTEFETPDQAVERIIWHQAWLWERAKGSPLSLAEHEELTELAHLLLDRRICTSGRTRWLGGTEISRKIESTMFNPLPLDQAFITAQGVRTFEDFNEGDEVTVLTHAGNWKRAVVNRAGTRKMRTISLRRGNATYEQRTSTDHTWIKEDGSRVIASDLAVGDRLHRAPGTDFYAWDFNTAPADEQAWWCYGFVFGDGALVSNTSRVRLCGAKAQYLERFTACGFTHSFPPSCDSDPMVYTGSYCKTLPRCDDDPRLIKAFLQGYCAADANKAYRRGITFFTGMSITDPVAADFVRTWMPVFGLYIQRDVVEDVTTNYGTRNATTLSFTTYGTPADPRGVLWTVTATADAPDEACCCLTVDDDHSFVLCNGVVTGNCAYTDVRTVHDIVDVLWLLLQGCGVGFRPVVGALNGFANRMKVEVVRSERGAYERGQDHNEESFEDGVWTIKVGDSSQAWAKSAGKLMAGKYHAQVLRLDFSEVRGPGGRLRSYGWISSGDHQIAKAYTAIAEIMNKRAGQLLTRIDILDIVNWLGTILSSRRSAEIALFAYDEPEADEFTVAKKDYWKTGNDQRAMSNNSLVFSKKPTKYELKRIFKKMQEAGGSEPGFFNGEAAMKRAPWFRGTNPCGEILLGHQGFCNLCETVLHRFNGDDEALHRAHYLVARANYRQTCVNLRDGILQDSWHQLNEFLRLCGVGVTGVVAWEHVNDAKAWNDLQEIAILGANSMADELGLPRSKCVTTIKPSGTQSKASGVIGMECPEGIHKPLGRFIFNHVRFAAHDPIVEKLRAAGYYIFPDTIDAMGVIVRLPVEYANIEFDEQVIGTGFADYSGEEITATRYVNNETALAQLERYKLVMDNYVTHNCSVTISYDPTEVPAIIDWLMENWDTYVGVSFIYRNDPTKTAEDLGYAYLPQQVVDEEEFRAYVASLKPVNLFDAASEDVIEEEMGCSSGACPMR